jgi:hypothetical protein
MALEGCAEYRAVAGRAVFALNTFATIEAGLLARLALSRAEWKSSSEAADWLFRILRTRTANVFLKAAIWGISVEEEIRLSESTSLTPFEKLPPTYAKGLIIDRKKWQSSQFVWYSDRHFDPPLAAYVRELKDVPFMAPFESATAQVEEAAQSAIEACRLVEAICVGHPLPLAYWLEFQDSEHDLTFTGALLTWSLPEVHPRIETVTELNSRTFVGCYDRFQRLSHEWRADLRRSMNRYTLSQCRRELIDRILDLALAFEIAVSQKGDNLAPRWKVSVRTAQIIGGALEDRKRIRRNVGRLYELRNKATHGSTLVGAEYEIASECARIYPLLLRRLLGFTKRPDWNSIELESVSWPSKDNETN